MVTSKQFRGQMRDLRLQRKSNQINNVKQNQDARRLGQTKAGDARRERRLIRAKEGRGLQTLKVVASGGNTALSTVGHAVEHAFSETGQTLRDKDFGKNLATMALLA